MEDLPRLSVLFLVLVVLRVILILIFVFEVAVFVEIVVGTILDIDDEEGHKNLKRVVAIRHDADPVTGFGFAWAGGG